MPEGYLVILGGMDHYMDEPSDRVVVIHMYTPMSKWKKDENGIVNWDECDHDEPLCVLSVGCDGRQITIKKAEETASQPIEGVIIQDNGKVRYLNRVVEAVVSAIEAHETKFHS